ncbi:hypothetical protein DIPPA_64196, partial [Diplonema papillatum]
MKVFAALAVFFAAAAEPDSCDSVGTQAECAKMEKCPEDNSKSCLWNTVTKACQCGKTCTMLPKEQCVQRCPEDDTNQCQWSDEELLCICHERTCTDYTKEQCVNKPCPTDTTKECIWIDGVSGTSGTCSCNPNTDTPSTPSPPRQCEDINSMQDCLQSTCPSSGTTAKKCLWVDPTATTQGACYCETSAPRTQPPPRLCETIDTRDLCVQ